LPSEIMIWQPEFTDKILSRKPGAVQKEEKMPMFQLGIDVSKNNLDLCLLRGTLKGRSKLVS
ncbi:hypothetical protein POY09_24215, partial [Escherichia coli]